MQHHHWLKLATFLIIESVCIFENVDSKYINFRSSANAIKGDPSQVQRKNIQTRMITLPPPMMVASREPYPCDRVTSKPKTTVWIRPSMPEHIDHIHFQVTTPPPFYTVGPIDAIGYHPTTNLLNPCEKIYMDYNDAKNGWWEKNLSDESIQDGDALTSHEYIRGPYKPRMLRIGQMFPQLTSTKKPK